MPVLQQRADEAVRTLLHGLLALHDAETLRAFADALPRLLADVLPHDSVALIGDLGRESPPPSGRAHHLAIRTRGAGRTLLGVVLGRDGRFTAQEGELALLIGPLLGAAADHVRLREAARGADLGVLTRREQQVLAQVADGRTDRDIAAALHIGSRTVEKHVEHIRAKLGARSRAEAVARWALAAR